MSKIKNFWWKGISAMEFGINRRESSTHYNIILYIYTVYIHYSYLVTLKLHYSNNNL